MGFTKVQPNLQIFLTEQYWIAGYWNRRSHFSTQPTQVKVFMAN
ncbi:hypothetical protein GXM_03801 [Nostoc sphaeroides CCNUC1]|uniref:Uncharacterized protein n=1 Tax=Nostoc sphaeroides CCNUC1 TaxID=2653204 RepID=A0A5P8W0X8_9NOSO|nr:hypothetical protein GXM_03801 [Nostoc sphaeroides CCNUC1]